MSLNPNTRLCSHIKVNGVPCGSPALRGEIFCYFHQRMIRGVRTPPKSRLHPIALIEDEEGIQASLMEVINALVRNTIDLPRAQLILRALHIAVRNSPRVHFDVAKSGMIHEVPNYPAAPAAQKPASPALAQAGVLAHPCLSMPVRIAAPQSETIAAPKSTSRVPPKKAILAAAAPNPARRKPPASVKPASRVRTFSRGRSG